MFAGITTMSRIVGTLFLAIAASTPAAAQESAVRSAADAFGERVGTAVKYDIYALK